VIACRAQSSCHPDAGRKGSYLPAGLPGGWSKSVSEEERKEIEKIAIENLEFGQILSAGLGSVVLKNTATPT